MGIDTGLPEIESYSDEELSKASSDSPAVNRYLGLIEQSPSGFEEEIRVHRHRLWLRAALASCLDKADPEEVCYFWSLSAEKLLGEAWKHCELNNSSLALFALGKLGARELNLSSDVDLMVVGNSTDSIKDTKKIKAFKRILENHSTFGFALRVDFDLRPDGNWGPLIVSIPSFQDHYWSRGETWERLALVRMRPLVGNSQTIQEITDLRDRFCYRRFTDFTLHEDLKQLRPRIHSIKTLPTNQEVDLKVSVGGIRDIELYIHSLQVIYGGRLPELRVTGTSEAAGLISHNFPDKALQLDWLKKTYWVLRNLENKVQLKEDSHTHTLEQSSTYPHLTSQEWTELQDEMKHVDELVSQLVGTVDLDSPSLPNSSEGQTQWLSELGFDDKAINIIWPQIVKATALSHKKDRDEVIRRELLFRFVQMVSKYEPTRGRLALEHFLDFTKSARAKATLFALLIREEKLLRLIVNLFISSNYMSQVITSRPELLDGLVYGHQELSPSIEESLEILIERRQISEIRSALLFQDLMDPETISLHLTSTADQIALDLKQMVKKEVLGSDFNIFALGKWGTFELGFHSDLDFILIKNGPISHSDHKAAKRFISYMRSPQRGGKIYDVDLRLRPSGSSGPLLVSLDQFTTYMNTRAEAWERQSYLKIRPLDSSLEVDMSQMLSRGLTSGDLIELLKIRSKLLQPISNDSLDIKYNPGGLLDLELCAQTAALRLQQVFTGATTELAKRLSQVDSQWQKSCPQFCASYIRLRQIEQSYRLTSQNSELKLQKLSPNFHDSAFLLQSDPDKLWADIEQLLLENQTLVKELDPIYTGQ